MRLRLVTVTKCNTDQQCGIYVLVVGLQNQAGWRWQEKFNRQSKRLYVQVHLGVLED
jgi:hypothetical protein